MTKSQELFSRAVRLIPGGVNSPVRAFGAVGGQPRFIQKAEGARICDVDGQSYLDYIGSWGPMILGHNHPAVYEAVVKAAENGLSFGAATEREVEMAELICQMVPSIEMVRMVNSGTEAVMSAVRAARGFTGRDKIIKFEGCYHGHSDAMLVKAGSGVMTGGQPGSAGVPSACVQDTLSAVYNDLSSVDHLIQQHQGKIAAIIVEPVGANMGVVPPKEGFLQGLRQRCTKEGILLIFDEVITGFRLGPAGAQGLFDVTPDITTFGKIIGAGMPVGAYGGRREIMECVSPCGKVYQAGTLSGNPVAMAAGLAQLRILQSTPQIYEKLNSLGEQLFEGMRRLVKQYQAPYTVNSIGSLGCLFFTPSSVQNYEDAQRSDTAAYGVYFRFMLENGIYLAPAQFEAMFLSHAHTREDIDFTLESANRFFARTVGNLGEK